jgi:hypothetical protein
MTAITIKVHPITYPNFVRLVVPNIPGQAKGEVSIDVADAFPNEDAASAFWDDAKEGWLQHVKDRRSSQLGKSAC